MKISIVIPVYNKVKYVKKCLESCLNQTFADYETIVVNDGSTDGSGEICQTMAEEHSQLQLINVENGGVTAARSIGVAHALGDYIALVDADDELPAHALQTLYDAMVNNKADEVIGTYTDQYGILHPTGRKGFVSSEELIKDILGNGSIFLMLGSVLFKKEWLKECLSAPRIIQDGEDKLMQIMYLMKHPKVYFIEDSVYNYTLDVPNNRRLNLEAEQVYDSVLREVLSKEWNVYQDYFTLRQIKLYENFVNQRMFGDPIQYYRQQIGKKLSQTIPLADKIAYLLPPKIAYYPIHWRKQIYKRK